jgi:adenylate cyclase
MATFGTREGETSLDAQSALRCALGAADALERWNAERTARGEDGLRVGIGLQCGEALVATIGTGERLEHTVIGDVVNVASRLERLTRQYGTPLLVSEQVFAAAGREGLDRDLPDRFAVPEPFEIRGRSGRIEARPLRTVD